MTSIRASNTDLIQQDINTSKSGEDYSQFI